MRPRELQFDFINRNCIEFRGFGAREFYTREYKRPPVYNTRTKSWVTTPDRARDLAAMAEARGWLVTFSGGLEGRTGGLPVGRHQLVPAVEAPIGASTQRDAALEVQVDELREEGLW